MSRVLRGVQRALAVLLALALLGFAVLLALALLGLAVLLAFASLRAVALAFRNRRYANRGKGPTEDTLQGVAPMSRACESRY